MARHPRKRRPLRTAARLLVLAAFLAGFFWWSNHALVTERFELRSLRLPAAFDGLRVVHLSDLHGGDFGPENRRLTEAVSAEAPDLIVVTGDLVDEHTADPLGYAAAFGRAMTALAPTYFVTGNHEWATRRAEAVCDALEGAGVVCLRNETAALERNGGRILLSGLDDPNGYADQKTPEQVAEELLAAYGEHDFRLLLAHRNDHFPTGYYRLGYDLTLCGHGHGGLFRLPFTDGLVGTNHDLFPSYTAGFYTVEGAELFVSRGLGNVGRTFRLFNRPEVAVLTLRRG